MLGRRAGIVHFPPEIDPNPYTRLLYAGLARHGFELVPDARLQSGWLWRHRRQVRFLHFHWEARDLYEWRRAPALLRATLSWLTLAWFAARLALARGLGYRIAWTIHEVRPHTSVDARVDRLAARALARASQALIAHDAATAERMRAELGRDVRIAIVPHGSYAGFYPPGRDRGVVRAELGVPEDAFVFLCFGNLKPYKRVDLLLAAFEQLDLHDARLVIAGECRRAERQVEEAVRRAAARDRRIVARLGLVPDERVAELFAASDAAVLSRVDGWTSGSLILALSLGRGVVAPRHACYEELTGGGRAAWLYAPGEVCSLRAALARAAADPEAARAKGLAAGAAAARLSWDEACSGTARLLEETVAVEDQLWRHPVRGSCPRSCLTQRSSRDR